MLSSQGQLALDTLTQTLDSTSFEIHPFKIAQYNKSVTHKRWHLPYPEDTLAFCIVSTPSYFDKIVKPYAIKNHPNIKSPVDDSTQDAFKPALETLKSEFPNSEAIKDSDMKPGNMPKVLMQVAGHVSGSSYFHRPSEELKKKNLDKPLMGVCIHPKYGGWFAFRGVFVCPDVLEPGFEAVELCPSYDMNLGDKAVELFNADWKDSAYRNILKVEEKYSDEQIEFFITPPKDRMKLVESWLN